MTNAQIVLVESLRQAAPDLAEQVRVQFVLMTARIELLEQQIRKLPHAEIPPLIRTVGTIDTKPVTTGDASRWKE